MRIPATTRRLKVWEFPPLLPPPQCQRSPPVVSAPRIPCVSIHQHTHTSAYAIHQHTHTSAIITWNPNFLPLHIYSSMRGGTHVRMRPLTSRIHAHPLPSHIHSSVRTHSKMRPYADTKQNEGSEQWGKTKVPTDPFSTKGHPVQSGQ